MFRGRYRHTIDPKGRLSVPAKFRDVLAQYDGHLVVVPNDHCLEVHPLEEWQRLETKLREQSRFNPEVREISRLYMSRAKDVTLDGAGRILLPQDARQQAGLEKEVTLVGGGLPQFEVWDRARFEEYERNEQPKLPSLFDKLASLGV
ncbi:MAG: division/cell wall cluster transcriptional repressor MraZ [Candidatus Rokubacteria bacterium]|nr:division/cell wall cluster transcriptional repressor MraZ [Candidatus Rokubacteria bacterium]